MMELTWQQISNARERLKHLLPEARAKVVETGGYEFVSPAAKAMGAYLREDNLAGVHIYHAPLGGWIADLYLKSVPPGISNVLGTPVSDPHKSYEEAREHAVRLLAMVLFISEHNKQGKIVEQAPVFQFYDAAFALSDKLGVLGELQAKLEGYTGYGDRDTAVQRLEAVIGRYFGDQQPSYDLFMKLDHDKRTHLLAIAHMCALSGVLRYPPNEPAIVNEGTTHVQG